MNRRNLAMAVGLFLGALLVGVAIYVGNLQAADTPASNKTPTSATAVAQIERLQRQIKSLEERIATLEKRPTFVSLPPNGVPQFNAPGPFLAEPPDENDGFPPARILLIGNKNVHAQPAH
ncbi:MAG TPA: hypothetical protein VMR25_10645 [Planctomycetaceae bacterium]|jgi:hypothetical protein|nr:hypothetical protein [Planctomycetaceae bacterium]